MNAAYRRFTNTRVCSILRLRLIRAFRRWAPAIMADDLLSEDEEEFSDRLVGDLVDRLDGPVILPLTYSEKSALATVAQATLEVRSAPGLGSQLTPSRRNNKGGHSTLPVSDISFP